MSTASRSFRLRFGQTVRTDLHRASNKRESVRQPDEVASVCYRMQNDQVEFLLVQTRGARRRWTFPKGGVESKLTLAQTAALESLEEAGVHGRIEENAFLQYRRRASGNRNRGDLIVNAYLCEVCRLARPKEAGRNRTWFSASEARLRLAEGRCAQDQKAFAHLINEAVVRISMRRDSGPSAHARHNHEFLRVRFEAPELAVAYARASEAYFRARAGRLSSPELSNEKRPERLALRPAQPGEVLPFVPPLKLLSADSSKRTIPKKPR